MVAGEVYPRVVYRDIYQGVYIGRLYPGYIGRLYPGYIGRLYTTRVHREAIHHGT